MFNKKIQNLTLILYFIFFIILFLFIYHSHFISDIKISLNNKLLENEFQKNDIFLKFCNDNKIKEIRPYKKIENPKVSVISPIYNRERFILKYLTSIQYQSFQDLEIILVDDGSCDPTSESIEKYKNIDKRIVILKNKKNKGTFKARNLGVLFSKAKYIIFTDPDDILSRNIIYTCYHYAEKYNYEIIRFNMYRGNGFKVYKDKIQNVENKVFYQPELSFFMFYGNGELEKIDSFVNNKFIIRELYMKALNKLNNFYFNMYMTFMEDSVINICFYRTAKSLYYLKDIGYYYTKNSESITRNLSKISELTIKFCFIFMKFIFENYRNTKYERDMANYLITKLIKKFDDVEIPKITNRQDIKFYSNIIETYLGSKYITEENKNILKYFKKHYLKKHYNFNHYSHQ